MLQDDPTCPCGSAGMVASEPTPNTEPAKAKPPGTNLVAAFGAGALGGFVVGLAAGIGITAITCYVVGRK